MTYAASRSAHQLTCNVQKSGKFKHIERKLTVFYNTYDLKCAFS